MGTVAGRPPVRIGTYIEPAPLPLYSARDSVRERYPADQGHGIHLMDIAGFGSIGSLGIPQITAVYGDMSAAHTLVGAFSDANILDDSLFGLGRRAVALRRQRLLRRQMRSQQSRRQPRVFRRRRMLMRVRSRGVPLETTAPVLRRRRGPPQGMMPPRGVQQGMGPRGMAAGRADPYASQEVEDDAVEDLDTGASMEVAPEDETPWGLILGGLAIVGGLVYYASKKGAKKSRSAGE